MNTRSICFALGAIVLVAYATAEVPPVLEDEMDVSVAQMEWSVAKNEVMLQMKSGKDDSACAKVAEDVKKEVTVSCKAAQKLVDDLPKGQHCCTKGAHYVETATRTHDDYKRKHGECKAVLARMEDVKIDFKPMPYRDLRSPPGCMSAWMGAGSDYATAMAAAKKQRKKCVTLKGKVMAAKKGIRSAQKQQDTARRQCRKETEKSAKSTLKTSKALCNADSNKKSWRQAAHMKCVLEHKSLDDCKVPSLPKLTKANLNLAICTGEEDVVGNAARRAAAAFEKKAAAALVAAKKAAALKIAAAKAAKIAAAKKVAAAKAAAKAVADAKKLEAAKKAKKAKEVVTALAKKAKKDAEKAVAAKADFKKAKKVAKKAAKEAKKAKKANKIPDGMHVCTCGSPDSSGYRGKCWTGNPKQGCCNPEGNMCMMMEAPLTMTLPGSPPPPPIKVDYCKGPAPKKCTGIKKGGNWDGKRRRL